MYIIAREADLLGGRPPMQTWSLPELPEGYAWCPDEFYGVFYSTTPAGFVNIEVTGDTVTAMTVNQAALDAHMATEHLQQFLADEKKLLAAQPAGRFLKEFA